VTASSASRAGRGFPGRAYALAAFGLHLAFIPLLSLLLPRRIEALFADQASDRLSALLLLGAITASLANIAAGRLGDWLTVRRGSRRALFALSAAGLWASHAGFGLARTEAEFIAAMIVFQCALNVGLSPLYALLSEVGSGRERSALAGALNAAQPAAALGASGVAFAFPTDNFLAFAVLGGVIASSVLPLTLALGGVRGGHAPSPTQTGFEDAPAEDAGDPSSSSVGLVALWITRFCVQLGAAFLLSYLFLYLANLGGEAGARPAEETSRLLAWTSSVGAVFALAGALGAGRVCASTRRRKAPMALLAAVMALCLAALAMKPETPALIAAFALFQFSVAGFLTVHADAASALVKTRPDRGVILGLINLANTLPFIVLPGLALLIRSDNDMSERLGVILGLCALVALVSAAGSLLVKGLR
jgi:MFS family permease